MRCIGTHQVTHCNVFFLLIRKQAPQVAARSMVDDTFLCETQWQRHQQFTDKSTLLSENTLHSNICTDCCTTVEQVEQFGWKVIETFADGDALIAARSSSVVGKLSRTYERGKEVILAISPCLGVEL